MLRDLKEKGARIAGISAPSRASTLVNYVGLDEAIIDYVCEIKGSLKIGKYMPGTLIPVVDESQAVRRPAGLRRHLLLAHRRRTGAEAARQGLQGPAHHAAAGAARAVTPMTAAKLQDKQKEIDFFDAHADADEYDVFTPEANARLIDAFKRLTGLPRGAKVADLGCGSGAFTEMLRREGYDAVGVDISPKLVAVGKSKYPGLNLIEGDVEHLPFETGSYDGVLLSGLVHHFPDPRKCAAETFRILQSGGRFMAFDPNRMNPFMYLYRDRSSPFYSLRRRDRERAAGAGPDGRHVPQGGIRGANGLSRRPRLSLCGVRRARASAPGL